MKFSFINHYFLLEFNISESLANYMTMVVDTKYSIQNDFMVEIQNDDDNNMLTELKNQLNNILNKTQLRLDELFKKVAVR